MSNNDGKTHHARHSSRTPAAAAGSSGAARMASARKISRRTAELTQRMGASSRRGRQGHERRTACSFRGLSADRRGSRRKAASKRPLYIAVIAVASIAVVGALLVAHSFFGFLSSNQQQKTSVTAGQQVTVTIAEGTGGSEIAQMLADDGVISDASTFLSAAQKQNVDSEFKPGTYSFVTGSDVQNVIDRLIAGPNTSENSITVTEGLTLSQIANLVEQNLGISVADFTTQAKASNYVGDYPFLQGAVSSGSDTLEGYLYPKTYDFSGQSPTADTVIRAMLDQFQKEVASLDFATAEASLESGYGVTMSDYDVLTLASIIEREALTDEQRPKIASVFYNRLKIGMYLDSDATMGYVTGGDVSAEDLETDSPYNSYLHAGLPPTPICSPGLASIQSALSPSSTSYYYFWITSFEEVFSETYEEHQQAISAAQGS